MFSEKSKNCDEKKQSKLEQAKSEQPKSEKLKFPQITTSSMELFLLKLGFSYAVLSNLKTWMVFTRYAVEEPLSPESNFPVIFQEDKRQRGTRSTWRKRQSAIHLGINDEVDFARLCGWQTIETDESTRKSTSWWIPMDQTAKETASQKADCCGATPLLPLSPPTSQTALRPLDGLCKLFVRKRSK